MVVAGLFIGINNTLITETVMKAAPVERGVASAAYSFMRFGGAAVAPWLAGVLGERISVHLPFWVGAGAVLLAAVRAVRDEPPPRRRRRTRKHGSTNSKTRPPRSPSATDSERDREELRRLLGAEVVVGDEHDALPTVGQLGPQRDALDVVQRAHSRHRRQVHDQFLGHRLRVPQ